MTTLVVPRRAARQRPSFRLRKRAYKTALVAHVLSSVGWFGIAVLVAFVVLTAAATGDPAQSGGLYRALALTPWLSIPAGIVAALTGVVLSLGTAHGLVRHWWVLAKVAISVAVVATDAAVVTRFAHEAAQTGVAAQPIYHAAIAHVVALAVATALSVFKPRGRTPWARSDA